MISIEKLSFKDSQSVNIISDMMYEWWGKESYLSPELMKEIIKSYCQNEVFPVVLIAKNNNEIVGTVTLLANDTQLRQDLFPLISSLYVKDNYRNKHIGTLLMEKIIDIARKNFNKVYLLTHIEGYYEKFGFNYIENTNAFVDLSNNKVVNDRLYVLYL